MARIPNKYLRFRATLQISLILLLVFGLIGPFGIFGLHNAAVAYADSPVCAIPGNDGPATVAGGIVNTYYPGTTAAVAVGATSLTVGAATGSPQISAGDLLLIIQMQGADINSTDTSSYGDGVSGGVANGNRNNANFTAGKYEYVVATNSVPLAGGTLTISSALVNAYSNTNATATTGQRRFQVVRIPQYASLTLNGTVTATPWNGTIGGIVAFDVAGALSLNGKTIDVSGQGFRGGGSDSVGAVTPYLTNYRDVRGQGASKGEGTAGTPAYLYDASTDTVTNSGIQGYPNGDFARGAPGNAGGGGNQHNAGGGGGGNGGTGGTGGNSWNAINAASTGSPYGGFGGAAIAAVATRITLGGGGGAGDINDGVAPASSGGAGGGLVLIRSGSVAGTGTINANGANGKSSLLDVTDAAGGAGAGGSVLITASSGTLPATLSVNAKGGVGGSNSMANTDETDGPGAGGGGGLYYSNTTGASVTLTGGAAGTVSRSTNPANGTSVGATSGANGASATINTATDLPTSISGAACAPQLTAIKTTTTPAVLNNGTATATYSIVLSNASGKGTATVVRASDTLPSGFTYASGAAATFSGGASGSATPTNSGTAAAPVFGDFTLPGGSSVTVNFTVNLAAGVAAGTYQNPANATYADPTRVNTTDRITPGGSYASGGGTAGGSNYASGSSTGEDVVVTVPLPDMTVSKTHATNFTVGINNSYNLRVRNIGAGPSSGTITVQDTLPTGLTYVSFANGTWSCSAAGQVVTCTRSTAIPAASYSDITINVAVGAAASPSVTNNATVSGGGQINTTNDTASDPTTVNPSADLSLTKSATPASPSVGQNVTYNLTVSNSATSNTATNVSIQDVLPAGVSFVSASAGCTNTAGTITCTRASIAAGTNYTFSIVATITSPGAITNSAQVSASDQIDPDSTPNNGTGNGEDDTASVTTPASTADLSLGKTVSNATPNVGTNVTFTLTANNAGPNTATGVTVRDVLPAGLTFVSSASGCTASGATVNCPVPNILNGASQSVTFVAQVTAAGAIINRAEISASDAADPDSTPNNGTGNGEDDIGTVVVTGQQADLQITKTGPASVNANGTVVYTIIVANNGPTAAASVVVRDQLPAGVTFMSATGGATPDGTGLITFATIGSLANGASQSFTVSVTAPANSATLVNTARATATTPDTDATNNNGSTPSQQVSTTVVPQADVVVAKSGPATVVANGTITYNIVVTNNGPSTAANVVARDTLPAGVVVTNAGGGTLASGVITFPAISSLANGASQSYSIQVSAPAEPTTLTNTARSTSDTADPTPANNNGSTPAQQVQTSVTALADLSLSKSASPSSPSVGQSVTYSLVVSNAGPSAATNVSVRDVLPSGVAFASASAACANAAGTVTCTTSSVAAGASTTFTIVATVTAAGAQTNSAQISASDQPDPDSTPNNGTGNGEDDQASVTTPQSVADLSLTKSAAPTSAIIGNNITFTLTANNAGPNTATGVTVGDTLPAGLSFVSSASGCTASGATVTCSVPNMLSGTSQSVTFVAQVTAAGVITNKAEILTSDQADPDSTPNTGTGDGQDDIGSVTITGQNVAVSGAVYRDDNGDGTRQAGETTGIANVSLTLSGTDVNGKTVNVTITTDASGNYTFNVPPGSYTITETQPTGYGSSTPNTLTVTVPTAGLSGQNFGETTSSFAGIVFNDLNNDGVKQAGESGIGGVAVTLTGTDAAGNAVTRSATTAADGTYTFANLLSGIYSLTETQPSAYNDGSDAVGSAGGTLSGPDSITSIALGAGVQATGYTFGERGMAISGTVYADVNGNSARDGGEPGIGGVTITLLDSSGTTVATTTTAADGSYSFSNLPADSYTIQETQPNGYATGTPNSIAVTLTTDGLTNQNFGEGTGSLAGSSYVDVNGNGVRDAGESGISGVIITLTGSDVNGNSVNRTVTSDTSGNYSFTGLVAGNYTLTETQPSGYIDGLDANGTPAGTLGNDVVSNITLGAGVNGSGYTFGERQVGGVTGFVFNDTNGNGTQEAGEPGVNGVTVTLYSGATVIATTTTLSDGSYSFNNVLPGAYTVTETQPAGYGSTTPNSVPVSVPNNGTATANFGDLQQGTVTGTVFSDLNGDGVKQAGEPGISSVTIELVDSGGAIVASTTTAANGTYTFSGVTPGSYTVREPTQPTGYVSTTPNAVGVVVPTGGVGSANFGEQQQGTVSGTVYTDTNGDGTQQAGESGLSGVTVQLLNASGAVIATTTTAGDGSYSFTGVTPGAYSVRETDPAGYVSTTPNTVPVSVPNGGSANASFGDQQTGVISGVAYTDTNGDGTQQAGESGLSGVTVQLLNATGTVIATTTTAGDGSYSFTGVTPGAYSVRETDPAGYVSTTPNTVPVSVPNGGSANASFGDQQTGVISGVAYTDTNGDGTQQAGENGLSGVTVDLLNSSGTVIATTTTAGDGSYSFTGVTPGAYSVRETDPIGYVSTTLNTVPVSVPNGGSASANFGDQQTGTISGTTYTDTNGDGTQQAGENGLSGVTVDLLNSSGTVIATTTTAGDGSYSFTGVTPGAYTVRETDPTGYVSTTPNTVPVSVPNGGSANASFGDQQTGTISGTTFTDTNGDGTQQASESGLSGVTVDLLNSSGTVIATTTTAGDGSYSFTGVTPGAYSVRETDPTGYVSTTPNTVPVSVPNGGSANASFGDQQTGTISGTTYTDTNGDGTQQAGENGLSGVTVDLLNSSGTVIATTTTAGDGLYSFTGVTPGVYSVRETDPAGYFSTTPNTVPVSVPNGGSANASFGDQQTGVISGVAYTDTNGDGTQQASESGLSGVTVQLLNATGTVVATTTTAGDGSYSFTGVTPGAYSVRETDPTGYVSTTPNTVPVSVPNGGSASASFGDQQTGVVAGVTYTDTNGDGTQQAGESGLSGVTVDLLNSSGTVIATTTTAGDGSYSFTGVTPGAYSVRETDPTGYVSTTPNTVPVSVPNGGSANTSFGDQQTGVVAGVAYTDTNGDGTQQAGESGLSGVTVQLLNASGAVIATTTTAGDGSYSFTGVTPGAYSVRETDPTGYVSTTPNTVPVSVPNGGSASASFGDQQQGTISGTTFTDTNGDGTQQAGESGLSGVTVQLLNASGTVIATTTTAGDGLYSFTGVTPGAYTVRETDPTGYVSTTPNTVPVSVPNGGSASANFGDQQTGTISGTTFTDTNGDGTQQAGESGLSGVTVQLLNASGTVIATTTTAGDGSYSFTGVTPGAYSVRETDPTGYVSTTPNTVPVSVPNGGSANASFGDQQTGVVAGVAYTDTNGDGTQQAGENGLGGVTVQLLNASGAVIATTTTAGDGSYSFTGVTPGAYSVRETDPTGYVSTTPNTVPVSVPNGASASASFGDQQTGTISGTTYTDTNGDGTQQAGESGLSGVTVQLLNASGAVIATTTTAGDGLYSFTGVTPGAYTVRETDPTGYVSTTPNTVPVSVPNGGSASANFGDQQTGTISGTTFTDTNGDGTQQAGESGLSGVTVQLLNASGTVIATTTTAGDGSYSFTGVTPGAYTVRETDPAGYVSTTPNTVPVSVPNGGSASANFGDQQQGTIAGAVYTDLNGDGAQQAGESGLGGVTVQLLNASGTVVATTTTAGDGSYSFTGVTPGAYSVRETDPTGYVSTTLNTVPVSVPNGGSASANFGDQQTGVVSGVAYTDTNGDGTQQAGESGLGGVTVQLLNATGTVIATTTTAGDGSYSFTGVTPGAYSVRETDPTGYVSTTPNTVPVSVPNGGSANASFGDQQQGTIAGAVYTDLNGDGAQQAGESGLSGVTVQLLNASGTVSATTTTAGDGSYSFVGVTPGAYSVRETDPTGYVSTTPNTVPVSVPNGGSANASFGDQQTGTINGTTFTDTNGDGTQQVGENGLGGVTIDLLSSSGTVIATTTTAGDGAYSFTGVTPGAYSVRETDPTGYASTTPNTVPVSVPNGGSANANFGDQQQGAISGIAFNDSNGDGVQQAGENGIGGVVITLRDGSGVVIATTTTAGNGSYSFSGITPGTYSIVETDPTNYVSTSPNTVVLNVLANGSSNANFGDVQTGTIGGIVFSDGDGNGNRNPGEAGIGGVTVQLFDGGGNVVATTVTVGDGSYLFTNVLPGNYTVVETDPSGYISISPNNPVVVLMPGSAGSANFADQPQGTVAGHLFIDTNGDGVQQPGEPNLANVTLTITDSHGQVLVVTTDGNGNYQAAVAPGSVTVTLDQADPDIPAGSRISTGANVQTVVAVAGTMVGVANVGFTIAPTSITLTSFTATHNDDGIAIQWATSSELNTWGFALYRSGSGKRSDAIKVTPELILARGRGSLGANYQWIDTTAQTGTTYAYWLLETELDQSTHEYGPVTAVASTAQATYQVFIPFMQK